ALLGLAAALIPSIAAQGYVSSITIDGKAYEGPKPTNGKSGESFDPSSLFSISHNLERADGKFAIRSVNSAQGLKGASNPDIGCGPGSQPASEHAEASPGSKIEVQWVGADGGAWPSSVGPVMAYMAPCPTMECRFVQPADAKWFKIYESSIRDDKTWAQEDLVQSKPASLILPAGLAKGAYLLRHEVIGLEDAKNEGGAQFYESCAQLNVSYGGSQTPDDSDLVSFPGAYSDTDKGILIDASSLGPNDYPYPGPPLAAIARGVNTGPSASMPAPTAAKRDDIPSSSA
ncbi:glycoside hydrolase, partial [Schizophyllum fasciatum]